MIYTVHVSSSCTGWCFMPEQVLVWCDLVGHIDMFDTTYEHVLCLTIPYWEVAV